MAHSHRKPGCDSPGCGQQRGAAAAASAQGNDVGWPAGWRSEAVWETPDRRDVRTAKRVNRLIGITDSDQLPAIASELHEQLLLSRIGVLILVHEDHVVGIALARPDGAAAQQSARDPHDLGVVVGGYRRQVESGRVGVKEPAGRYPVVAVMPAAQRSQAASVQPPLGRPEQEVPQLRGESLRAYGSPQSLWPAVSAVARLTAQESPDLKQLLRSRQQDRRLLASQRVLAPDQPVRVTVEGQCQRLSQGAVKSERDALAQLGCGLTAEGEDEHATGINAAAGHPVDDSLHDRRGLARTGTGEHKQGPAVVLDDSALGVIEARRHDRRRWLADESVGGRGSFHLASHSSRRCRHWPALPATLPRRHHAIVGPARPCRGVRRVAERGQARRRARAMSIRA